jgi:hypothetical protein
MHATDRQKHSLAIVLILALSLGERVASVASRVRGYVVMLAHLIRPRRASDPSPGPRRLVKAPVAAHPLPLGRGQRPNSVPFSSGKRQKTEVGPLCPARGVGHAQMRKGSLQAKRKPVRSNAALRRQLLRNHFGLCEQQKVIAAAGFRVCA